MNYHKIYASIIERARNRSFSNIDYFEKHHVIPKCQGGTDLPANLVNLTAREHFIAHLCLVKMYPGHFGLVKAAMMMSVCRSTGQERITNRVYSWLKREHAKAMSICSLGTNNSQFGKCWIVNFGLNEEKKVDSKDLNIWLNNGWSKGRKISNRWKCLICHNLFSSERKKKTCSKECFKKLKFQHKVFDGRDQEFLDAYKKTGSMNKALKQMGFPGAISHYYSWAKTLIN